MRAHQSASGQDRSPGVVAAGISVEAAEAEAAEKKPKKVVYTNKKAQKKKEEPTKVGLETRAGGGSGTRPLRVCCVLCVGALSGQEGAVCLFVCAYAQCPPLDLCEALWFVLAPRLNSEALWFVLAPHLNSVRRYVLCWHPV